MQEEELPKFVDNSSYSVLDDSLSETEHLYGMLNNIKRIHHLTVQSWDSHEDLISSLLKAGCQIFALETGIVSRIVDQSYEIIALSTTLDGLESGAVFDLKGTYCYDVFRFRRIIGYPEVGQLRHMKDHPVYQAMKLEAYLSAPIYVNDELFGTINFTSKEARKDGFSEHEHDLIMLLAGAIGNQLRLDEEKKKLKDSNERMRSLVG